MDASKSLTVKAEIRYRCPGESYFIDRPIHLARLAEGYAPCRICTHRLDTLPQGSPEPIVAAPTTELARPAGIEGIAGVALNEIDVGVTKHFAAAFGQCLRQSIPAGEVPRVVLGSDGRRLTAPLIAAAGEGLQLAGCRVIETGGGTTGLLAYVIAQENFDGGVLIGNAWSMPQTVSLNCWGLEAQPWSAGGRLDAVQELLEYPLARASRRFGGLERINPAVAYRAHLEDLFHGLRPLRFVLDTASEPLAEHLRDLIAHSACQIIRPAAPSRDQLKESSKPSANGAGESSRQTVYRRRRVERLCQQVIAESAHFGLWIDGDGDTLELVDEQGQRIAPERLLLALLGPSLSGGGSPLILLENESDPEVKTQLLAIGARVVEVQSSREAVDLAMRQSGALAAGGPSGRLWFATERPVSDALLTLGALLQLLSKGDHTLSEVLN